MKIRSIVAQTALATSQVVAGPISTPLDDLKTLNQLEVRQSDTSSFRFLNSKTSSFQVESLPDVPFNIGEMYSGLMPIKSGDKSRELFFVFQPTVGEPVDELVIWMNGGPGCSSLEGFFQENGLFLWHAGDDTPTENPYSWVKETNMLW